MKSNYKRLGDYIRQIDVRNKDEKVTRLLGVSIDKKFIESIANIIGTDMSVYKIVRRGQFAYGPVTSRNGDKVSIALLPEEECIISSSYTVFEIIDTKAILPEYLNLWFKRSEFDRYARFHSHGSAREIFDWEEMCNVELPIPSIEEQQKIVDAYETIEKRIAIKKKINENLINLGISIVYQTIGKTSLIDYNKDENNYVLLPDNFKIKTISDFCIDTKSGATPSRNVDKNWKNGNISWVKSGEVHNNIIIKTEECITEDGYAGCSVKMLPKDTVLMAMYGVTAGELGYLGVEATTNQAICGMICKSKAEACYLYFSLMQSQKEISRLSNGGAQDNISKKLIDSIRLIVPSEKFIAGLKLDKIINLMKIYYSEIYLLEKAQSILLAQLTHN